MKLQLKLKQELIQEEQYSLNEVRNKLKILERKWFKRSRTFKMIKILKRYIELKEKFIDEIGRVENDK